MNEFWKIKKSNFLENVSTDQFLPPRTKLSTEAELWTWLKDGKRSSNEMVNT